MKSAVLLVVKEHQPNRREVERLWTLRTRPLITNALMLLITRCSSCFVSLEQGSKLCSCHLPDKRDVLRPLSWLTNIFYELTGLSERKINPVCGELLFKQQPVVVFPSFASTVYSIPLTA